MALILRYFTEFGSFEAHCAKVVEHIVVKRVGLKTADHRRTPQTTAI